jgi:2-dehydropantoate 2-reductase
MSHNSVINKVCIYGIGGVGGYFGSKIAKKFADDKSMNHECYFIARGEHLEAIKRKGIKVITPIETIVGIPTIATNDISELSNPDLFLLCVKSYNLDEVVKSIKSVVHEKTVIIPLLNGADIYERTRRNIGVGIVLPACVFVGTHIQQAGVISHDGGDGKILFGKDPEFPEFEPDTVIRFFDYVGINYQWSADPRSAIWTKYIFIASFGLVTVFTGKNLGEIMEDKKAIEMVRKIMQEIYNIAKSKSIELSENIIDESIAKANNFPDDTRTSYQRDVESKGRENEGDLYGGAIIREGESLGIPTPVTKSIYSEIQNRLNE